METFDKITSEIITFYKKKYQSLLVRVTFHEKYRIFGTYRKTVNKSLEGYCLIPGY